VSEPASLIALIKVLDEHSLMQQIRDSVTSNPRLAETLAIEGRQRFPDSPDSEERDNL
jgi:hypothetical protein